MNLIEMRREFHKYPETAFTEFWTASKVAKTLQSFGYEVILGADALDEGSRRGVPAKDVLEHAYERAIQNGADREIAEKMKGGLTAVVATLRGSKPGPTIAFRFDMDALPVNESTEEDHLPHAEDFRSTFEGNMHACAHDAHTTIGLALAEKMAKEEFSGTLKLLFQPGEEGSKGAYAMVQKGMLDDVDRLYCFHLGLDVPLGEISGGSTGWLASTKLLSHFHGVPSHSGAAPEKGKNALIGAATALLNIHSLPRYSSEETRVNVGILEGGTAVNIIPDYAKMLTETRSTSSEVNAELEERVRSILAHSADMHGLRHEIEVVGQSITIDCNQELVDVVTAEAQNMEFFKTVIDYHKSGAGEDASLLIKRVQERGGLGTYMMIGTTIPAPHHHQKFDIDEAVLEPAVELMERIAKRELT